MLLTEAVTSKCFAKFGRTGKNITTIWDQGEIFLHKKIKKKIGTASINKNCHLL